MIWNLLHGSLIQQYLQIYCKPFKTFHSLECHGKQQFIRLISSCFPHGILPLTGERKQVLSQVSNFCWTSYVLYFNIPESETPTETLRSLLAQLEFKYEICKWERLGVPFKTHLYVPETDPITGAEFHDREDHNHVHREWPILSAQEHPQTFAWNASTRPLSLQTRG